MENKSKENDFQETVKNVAKDKVISPSVKKLIGIAKLPSDFNVRKEYTEYLMKKYE